MTQRKREPFEEELWHPDTATSSQGREVYGQSKPRNRRKAARYGDLIRNAHAVAEKHGIGPFSQNVYKIRNQEGLFSSGGTYPKWSKVGKVWASRNALSNHLTLVNDGGPYEERETRVARGKENEQLLKYYDGCSIVVYNIHEELPIRREK